MAAAIEVAGRGALVAIDEEAPPHMDELLRELGADLRIVCLEDGRDPADPELKTRIKDSLSDKMRAEIRGLVTFGHVRIDAATLERFPNLLVVSNLGAGVDHIDLNAASARGVRVGHTPNLVNAATADMALALMLSAARNVTLGDRLMRDPARPPTALPCPMGTAVSGQTLGILGMGRIGKEVAKRALAFDMALLYHNRSRLPEAEEKALRAAYRSKDELFAESDFVVVVVPLKPDTRGLVGAAELRRMKRSAVLVNVARGPVVDTQALVDALREGRLFAAGLDVTDPEPLPPGHALLSMPNVVVSPHLGTAAWQTRRAMLRRTLENLLLGLRGERLLSQANKLNA